MIITQFEDIVTLWINCLSLSFHYYIIKAGEACSNAPNFAGAPKIASAVQQIRNSLVPSGDLLIQSYSEVFPFGPTNMNLTLER
jgi:hypothetical protein